MSAAPSATPDDPRGDDYSHPTRSCDIVMKGGITSGVVYPQAVCELARTYRLRNVGGTSAGAIAAAAAAAAELGRESGGFAKLAALPAWIGEGTHLQSLFQAQRGTRPLFRVLLAAISGGRARVLRILAAVVVSFPLAVLLGATPGALLFVAVLIWASGALLAIGLACGLLLSLLGFAIAVLAAATRRLTTAVPDNYFGLCSGNSPTGAMPPALTPWLADQLDRFARGDDPPRDAPLTFGELWAGPASAAPPADGQRWLNLEMMTTNLTNRRPERLPWQSSEYFFDPHEFADLFPTRVVEWLAGHPPAEPEAPAERRDWRLRCALMRPLLPMPPAAELPVIVATRLSLSFPLLLSALPLWTIDMSRERNQQALAAWRRWAREHDEWEELLADPARRAELEDDLGTPQQEICWFSDGGISSNFPIHFFDTPLPRWPTFGVNLRPFHPDHPRGANEADNVWMPTSNAGGILEWWYRFPSKAGRLALIDGRVAAFASAVVRTMQNHVDEAQMRMPGYRDRVAHIGTDADEGGMNLTMKPEVLHRLNERGRLAGVRLVTRFATPGGDGTPLTWANHRWVRYRSSMAAFEGLLRRIGRGYARVEHPDDASYGELIGRGRDEEPDSYRWERADQQRFAAEATDRLVDIDLWAQSTGQTFGEGAPQPAPEAKIGPRS